MGRVGSLRLDIRANITQLTGEGIDIAERHEGLTQTLLDAVAEVQRSRRRHGPARADASAVRSMRGVGILLAESFLGPKVTAAIREHLGHGIDLAIAVTSGVYPGLPWEALILPGTEAPLALEPNLRVYRRVPGSGRSRQELRPGPLRIAVAVSAPTENGGPLLDYERELREIDSAVQAARRVGTQLKIVRYATLAALRDCLVSFEPHVLHISAHGGPGTLSLEDEEGRVVVVAAAEFVRSVFHGAKAPELVSLAACYTSAQSTPGSPSFAATLISGGAAAVVGTETSVTDRFSTLFFAQLYGELAGGLADVPAAVAAARRSVQTQLDASSEPGEHRIARLDEWAIVTVSCADDGATLRVQPAEPGTRTAIAEDADFVGRRAEQRLIVQRLNETSVTIHGIGGIGKSSLALQVADQARQEQQFAGIAVVASQAGIDVVLDAAADALRLPPSDEVRNRVMLWPDRLSQLRRQVNEEPLLLLLDGDIVGDDQHAFLAAWASAPELRLLHTCRLPADIGTDLIGLAPLSLAESTKLAWSLSALSALDDGTIGMVWRALGGHPQAWVRLSEALGATSSLDEAMKGVIAACWRESGAADRFWEIATDRAAYAVLLAASVYRVPFAPEALKFQLVTRGEPGSDHQFLIDGVPRVVRSGLLCQHMDGELEAYHWLSPALFSQIDPRLQDLWPRLHNGAAEYWKSRFIAAAGDDPYAVPADADIRYLVEADEHFLQAGEFGQAVGAAILADKTLKRDGAWAERENILRRHLDLPDLDPGARAGLLRALGEVALVVGDYDGAMTRFREALADLGNDGRDTRANQIRGSIGIIHEQRGEYDKAATIFTKTAEIARGSGDGITEAYSVSHLATLAERQGDYERAARLHVESLRLTSELGDRAGMASALHQLGMIAQFQGDLDMARQHYEAAADLRAVVGDAIESANSIAQLGVLAIHQGKWAEARARITNALEVFDLSGDQPGAAICYEKLGVIAHAFREFDLADNHLRRALTMHRMLGTAPGVRSVLQCLADLSAARGDFAAAADLYEQCLTGLPGDAGNLRELLRIAAVLADYEANVDYLERYGGAIIEGMARKDADQHGSGPRYILDLPYAVALTGDIQRAEELHRDVVENVFRPFIPDPSDLANAIREPAEQIEGCRRDLADARFEFQAEQLERAIELAAEALRRGQLQDAGRFHRYSVAFAEQLAAHRPQRSDLRIDVAFCCDQLGDLAFSVGRLTEAEDWYSRAMQVRTELLRTMPGDERLARGIAVMYERLAMIAEQLERHNEAMEYFDKLRAIRLDLTNREPHRQDLAEEYAVNMTQLAQLDPNRATEARQRARELLEGFENTTKLTERAAAILRWARERPS